MRLEVSDGDQQRHMYAIVRYNQHGILVSMGSRNRLALSKNRLKSLIAKPWLLPDKALAYFLTRLTHRLCLSIASFGWLQAIFYSLRIDQWQRLASVARQIKALSEKPLAILDVGGQGGISQEFLNPNEYRLCILDINTEALRAVGHSQVEVVAGDGCFLPFKDNSFDVVVSVDSLEHVAALKKVKYCRELKRVAKKFVIIHCPADSADGKFQGTTYDTKFLRWYQQRFKEDETNTVEHLNSKLPKVEELLQLFTDATVIGKQNAEIWLKYMTWEFSPYIRFVNGVVYKLHLQTKDDLPPYHACLLVWRKQ